MGENNGRAPAATELVYVPEPSWTPALIAFGLAGVLVGIYAGWAWAALGAAIVLLALRKWAGDVAEDLRRMPRSQTPTTAPLPTTPMRSARD